MTPNVIPIRPSISIDSSVGKRQFIPQMSQRVVEFLLETKKAAIDALDLYSQSGRDMRQYFFPKTTKCVRYFQTISLGLLTSLALSGEVPRDTPKLFDHRQRTPS